MESSSVKKNNYGLLSHSETMDLIKKAQQGDENAQTLLVNHNLGLVKSVLRRFINRGHEPEDLYQLGCIGLLKAIQKFDINYDVKFSTYAVPMIVGEIKRFLRDDGIIKVSRSLKQTAMKANIAKEKLTKDLGREPNIQEIADEICVDKEEVVMALDSNAQPDYLYDVIHQNDGSPIHLIDKVMTNEDEDIEVLDKITLKQILGQLKPRDRQIIIMRYFKDKTQTEIASMLGISQVQVSRIEKRVLHDMKDMLTKV
ncbi:RNA polymerase sigma-F factor Stage II sporulation protein AC [Proteiniborus sp. DW1]|uniref:RNA polymerase sporulation sigma factor SigF n=1 Tax=Proteiniborus sp. DW1 TaxID=1889883 RepID=UPI00092E1832|nr:RNA polymerase sporulation sigma factor SigF [Proteiniborus sp. DW1]SCG83588.1 RNA polymerase sigma-F factor Stage II sporulation protein AC [Proteiniborus sp. DW1]